VSLKNKGDMKKVFVILSILFVILIIYFAYSSKNCCIKNSTTNDSIQKPDYSACKSLKDSLKVMLIQNKDQSKELMIEDDNNSRFVLYLNKLNNKKVAVIAFTDTCLIIFQNLNNEWVQIDSVPFNSYASKFEITDLNGDNKDDLIVYGFANMHGERLPYVFITDKNNVLHYRSDIHLYNIKYDKTKKLIMSYYQGGAYSINCKEYYYWQGDSLKLLKGVEQNLSTGESSIFITFYKLKDGKRFDYKKMKDNKGAIYDTVFWTDEY